MSIAKTGRFVLTFWATLLFGERVEAAPEPASLQELRAKYAQPASKYMSIKGVEVHYLDEGSGPAILMIHGSYSSLRTYNGVAAALKGRYRVIRYDIPPQGLSGPVSDEALKQLTPESMPELLLTQLGVRSATVVGVSYGGTIAYYFAAKRPDMVERLVLANTPAASAAYANPKKSKRYEAESQANKTVPFPSYAYWDSFLDYFTGEPERMTPALRQEYFDMNRRIEKNLTELVAKTANEALTVANTAKVTGPVLLIWGARDPMLGPDSADVLAQYLKHADVSKVLMPDVGHYPPLEAPERFAKIVAAYIEAATPVKPIALAPADR